ncbi:hypothetical protein PENSPDRAFT_759875 [Peniophora sp. CONT]|nr:hypothetical protein PENSPDRAFT_759875 [Peniophora sp. CONT]
MAPPPHRLYSDELSRSFQRGLPIANPQAVVYTDVHGQCHVRPVEIGDVGFIQPDHGHFVSLFNVHREPGVDGQPLSDELPDGFVPLRRHTIMSVTDLTPSFVSESVSVKEMNVAASGPYIGGFAGFAATSKRGAILATPDPIECHNAHHILSYRIYARDNIEGWVDLAKQVDDRIELEDLILVTGVDRTTSWATAVFSDKHLNAGFGLQIQFVGAGPGVQLACRYTWQNATGALVNAGPAPSQLTATAHPRSWDLSIPRDAEHQPLNTVCDQTLFVRHLRAKRRRPWRGLKLMARGERNDSDNEMDDDPSNIDITSVPERTQFTDSLEPILDYILENTRANIAIAHDDDLNFSSAMKIPSLLSSIIDLRNGIGVFLFGQPEAPVQQIQLSQDFWGELERNIAAERSIYSNRLGSSHTKEVLAYLPTPDSSDTPVPTGQEREAERAGKAPSHIQHTEHDQRRRNDGQTAPLSEPSHSRSPELIDLLARGRAGEFSPKRLQGQMIGQTTDARPLTPPPDVPGMSRNHGGHC